MADLEKIVKLIFEGDGTGLSREMKLVSRDFDNFSRDVQAATAPLGDFGMKVAKAELALIALGTAGLVYAFNKAKEFEAGAIELDKVLSDEEGLAGGLDQAKQKAIEFSDTYGESSSNILSSIAEFRQANFTLAESIGLTEDAMRLKIAGDLEAAESSQYLKQILSGFAAEASDAGMVIDQLNSVSNNYNSNVRELAIGLGDLSGVSDTVNMSYAETLGVLTPVIEVFGSGSEAARALRTGLIRMVDDTPAIVNAMDSIGVSQYEANGELKNAYEILGDVAKAFETTDESQQLFIAGQIFGKEQASKMVQVIRDWDNVLEITETALNGVGSAQIEVDKRLQSSQVAVDRFVVGWENLNAAIGGKFAESANGTINGLTDIENALRESLGDETFDVIWDAINSFFADTETLLKDVAQNLPEALAGVDFSKLVESFKGLGAEIGDALDALFGGELDLSTVEGLEKAIQKIVDIATKMTEFTEGFIEGLNPLLVTIGKITTGITDMDAEGTKLAGNVTGWAKDINVLFGALDGLKVALYAIAVGVIPTGLSATIGLLGTIGAPVLLAVGAVGALGAALYALSKPVMEIKDKISGITFDDLKRNWNALVDEIMGSMPGEMEFLKFEVDSSITELDKLHRKSDDIALSFFGVSEEAEEVKKTVAELPDAWVFDMSVEKQSLDDLLSLPMIETGLEIPVDVVGKYSLDGTNWTDVKKEVDDNIGTPYAKYSLDGTNWVEVELEVDKHVPSEKEVEVKLTVQEQAKMDLERDLANIEASAENLQTAMEWTAKVDIAEIEAAAELGVAAFDNVGDSVVAVTDAVASMFSAFTENAGDLRLSDKWFAMDALEAELEMQSKLIDSQVELNAAQAEYMRLKNERIESGETADILIDTTGVEPALEMVMWQIIEKVQIRANENAQEFLLGMPSV